jgi:transposase
MKRDGLSSGFQRSLVDHQAAAARGCAAAPWWQASSTGSRGADRDPVRAADRHPMGDAAARDGVWVRHHLLAPSARLAGSGRLGWTAPRVAPSTASSRQGRLEPCVYGQRLCRRQKGGDKTGPNPTDRGRLGTKRHLITDRNGLPLAFVLTGANTNDSVPFEELLDSISPIAGQRGRARRRPDKLHADKAYDHRRCRQACHRRGIAPRIARRGVETSQKLGRHRWVIERTFAWVNRFRRLVTRYERRSDIHHALTAFACSLICFNALQDRF